MKGKIFNEKEVQAILNGSKVMFREVIKPQPYLDMQEVNKQNIYGQKAEMLKDFLSLHGKAPYQVGQKIFCKESFGLAYSLTEIFYKANFNEESAERIFWKPAQHMKQEHSRLTLQIKEIRVERLRSIREEDCLKEWIDIDTDYANLCVNIESQGGYENSLVDGSAIKTIFAKAWNATHKKPEEKFEANPFCWVISMEVVK
jgi:hypothetical protein